LEAERSHNSNKQREVFKMGSADPLHTGLIGAREDRKGGIPTEKDKPHGAKSSTDVAGNKKMITSCQDGIPSLFFKVSLEK